jgi:hypothetical protein
LWGCCRRGRQERGKERRNENDQDKELFSFFSKLSRQNKETWQGRQDQRGGGGEEKKRVGEAKGSEGLETETMADLREFRAVT